MVHDPMKPQEPEVSIEVQVPDEPLDPVLEPLAPNYPIEKRAFGI